MCKSNMNFGLRLSMSTGLLIYCLNKCVCVCLTDQRLSSKGACGHALWEDLSTGSSSEQMCHLWDLWDQTDISMHVLLKDDSSNCDNRFMPNLCIKYTKIFWEKSSRKVSLKITIVPLTSCKLESKYSCKFSHAKDEEKWKITLKEHQFFYS